MSQRSTVVALCNGFDSATGQNSPFSIEMRYHCWAACVRPKEESCITGRVGTVPSLISRDRGFKSQSRLLYTKANSVYHPSAVGYWTKWVTEVIVRYGKGLLHRPWHLLAQNQRSGHERRPVSDRLRKSGAGREFYFCLLCIAIAGVEGGGKLAWNQWDVGVMYRCRRWAYFRASCVVSAATTTWTTATTWWLSTVNSCPAHDSSSWTTCCPPASVTPTTTRPSWHFAMKVYRPTYWLLVTLQLSDCILLPLQCFDNVGWATEGRPVCK